MRGEAISRRSAIAAAVLQMTRVSYVCWSPRQYPYHLKYVTTLPWEIKKSFLQIFSRYGKKCKQILIFSVFEILRLSPYRLQIKFSKCCFLVLDAYNQNSASGNHTRGLFRCGMTCILTLSSKNCLHLLRLHNYKKNHFKMSFFAKTTDLT